MKNWKRANLNSREYILIGTSFDLVRNKVSSKFAVFYLYVKCLAIRFCLISEYSIATLGNRDGFKEITSLIVNNY